MYGYNLKNMCLRFKSVNSIVARSMIFNCIRYDDKPLYHMSRAESLCYCNTPYRHNKTPYRRQFIRNDYSILEYSEFISPCLSMESIDIESSRKEYRIEQYSKIK